MSSGAERRLVRISPSIITPLFSQSNLPNILSSVAVNRLGEMVSLCLIPLLIMIFSLSLCRCTVAELSVHVFRDFCLHIVPVLAMMSILLCLY